MRRIVSPARPLGVGAVMVAAALLGAAAAEAGPRGTGRGAKDAGAADASAGALDAGAADASASDAAASDPSANDAGSVDAGADDAGVSAICIEHVPTGATRPLMREELTVRGTSGYAAELKLVITHGKGETVLPEGFRLQAGSDAAKELQRAGFVVPDPGGGTAPKITVEPGSGGTAVTTIVLPVVPLPPKPGRNVLELPPLPIAIARANNEYVTICTARHRMQVEDPIANELDPKVHPNPPGRQQREDWPLARQIAIGVPIGLLLALAGALGYRWWSRRPKVEPVKARIPPWVTALEELGRIRRSSLLEEGKTGEHFDRVSEAVRVYLGARYGFETVGQGYNGLETTTGEMLDLLNRVRPAILELPRIKDFLDDCDLVKFARFTPTDELCQESLARGEMIVRRTIPVMQLPSPPRARDDGDADDERERERRDAPPDDLPPPEASS
jgi:hypothetical protein